MVVLGFVYCTTGDNGTIIGSFGDVVYFGNFPNFKVLGGGVTGIVMFGVCTVSFLRVFGKAIEVVSTIRVVKLVSCRTPFYGNGNLGPGSIILGEYTQDFIITSVRFVGGHLFVGTTPDIRGGTGYLQDLT